MGCSRSGFPLYANVAAPLIVELILGHWDKKGANYSNWHDRYSTIFDYSDDIVVIFELHLASENSFKAHFWAHNSSSRNITISSSWCVRPSGRGRKRIRRLLQQCLWQWWWSQSWFRWATGFYQFIHLTVLFNVRHSHPSIRSFQHTGTHTFVHVLKFLKSQYIQGAVGGNF